MRKRNRMGRSKYKHKERKEKNYPERKPLVKAKRRLKDKGKLGEGGPKGGEILLWGGKESDDQELVGRMGTPEKMIKGNSSDKPSLSTGLINQPNNLKEFDLKVGEKTVKEKIKRLEEKKREMWRRPIEGRVRKIEKEKRPGKTTSRRKEKRRS